MRTIPVPCVNCTRFHYKECREPPNQCWTCGMYGHLERFCPTRRIWSEYDRNAPLPGTNDWCKMFGLDKDPDLRRRVLSALKASPGSSITIDGRCIYRGGENHFSSSFSSPAQNSERRRDHRSRSPSRERNHRKRSRSPLRRYSRDNVRGNENNYREYRERSKSRGRSRSRDGCLKASSSYDDRHQRSRSPARNRNPVNPNYMPLGQVSSNLSRIGQTTDCSPIAEVLSAIPRTGGTQAEQPTQVVPDCLPEPVNQTLSSNSTAADRIVDDPHFVLGVGKGATEAEILKSYRERMWEIELERMADASYNQPAALEPGEYDIFDESIKILKAAKKQLVGY